MTRKIVELEIPKELIKDIETIDHVIDALKMTKLCLQGKTITSSHGLINKIKILLGYVLIQDQTKPEVMFGCT